MTCAPRVAAFEARAEGGKLAFKLDRKVVKIDAGVLGVGVRLVELETASSRSVVAVRRLGS